MYPNLSYILHDLIGTDYDNLTRFVQTFGLFLALAFLTAAYFLFLELKRKKNLFPYKLIKDENGNTRESYPHERVGDMTMIAAISGMLGAKIFAIFESAKDVKDFLNDPFHVFFSPGGLAIYGGLIFGFIAVFWFVTRTLKMNALHAMDAFAPSMILGYGVGRIGCQLSGDGDWGIISSAKPSWWFLPDWLWSFDYPRNVVHEGVPIEGLKAEYFQHLVPGVYPTPIYEMVMAFAIGGFLWSIRKRIQIPGLLFMIYMILNGIERYFIEKIRVNSKFQVFGLSFTQAEFIAVVVFLVGIIGAFILLYRHKKIINDSPPPIL